MLFKFSLTDIFPLVQYKINIFLYFTIENARVVCYNVLRKLFGRVCLCVKMHVRAEKEDTYEGKT